MIIDARELRSARAEKHVAAVPFPTKSKNESESLTGSKQTVQEVLILPNNLILEHLRMTRSFVMPKRVLIIQLNQYYECRRDALLTLDYLSIFSDHAIDQIRSRAIVLAF